MTINQKLSEWLRANLEGGFIVVRDDDNAVETVMVVELIRHDLIEFDDLVTRADGELVARYRVKLAQINKTNP
jgi:hypothetical protein